ncbi:MAG: hypothetical protein QGH61_11365, partial [Candidatus Marinimicrobia bacterium]|nr:hypothetical protein [Candidatus Neomarinimicrobiota bacterium]
MKKLIKLIAIAGIFCSLIFAGDAEDVKQRIEDSFAHLNKMKKSLNDYSKDGALEFWSSGGLLQTIDPTGRPETYDEIKLTPKHIEVV